MYTVYIDFGCQLSGILDSTTKQAATALVLASHRFTPSVMGQERIIRGAVCTL